MVQPRVFRQPRFAPPPGAAELLLVRHGESEMAVEGESFDLVDGQGDPPLSAEGRGQADRLGERLAGERVDAVYVTNLRRTAETAAPLAERIGLNPVVEPDLREVFLGEWEGGVFRQKMTDLDPIALKVIAEQRWEVIPGAESSSEFSARVRAAITRLAAAHADQRVVIVSHGGTIGEVLAQATRSEPWAFVGSDNASISQLVVTGDRWILRRYNDTAHLDGGFSAQGQSLT